MGAAPHLSLVPTHHATEVPTRWQEWRWQARAHLGVAWDLVSSSTADRVPVRIVRESTYRRMVRNAFDLGHDAGRLGIGRPVR